MDEEVRGGGARDDASCTETDRMFEGANGGSADGDDTTRIAASLIDGGSCARRNGIRLGVNFMILDAFDAYGLKSSQADMQRDVGSLDAAPADAIDDFWGEMKAGGGGSHRAALPSVDGLIALAIAGRIRTRDIGRKWDVADAIENGVEIVNRAEANAAFAEFSAGENLSLQLIELAEKQVFANANLAAGSNQAFPIVGRSRELAGEENLDAALEEIASRGIAGTDGVSPSAFAAAIEPCRKDAGVVEDEQIAGL